ncbi:hypothetical protein [Nonomuraea dietziae]|uniref:Membrane associated rhomboid family serine protease n=1 Tax=Nonomuraea dietziae TaxID=65515 RepID=A0A7W5VHJ4_9ACTN|nr:hypothetical protein [Nonomuraea dietziae]MBB3731689.1 membrane associated rhomboid family serine protease [Nonomuraea dietziae]
MNKSLLRNGLLGISFLYGIAIAIMAILGLDGIGVFAAIGGIVVGALWAVYGYLDSDRRTMDA